MERKVTYNMKGILNVTTGEITKISKEGAETIYAYKDVLDSLDGQEVKLSITYTEDDEEDAE